KNICFICVILFVPYASNFYATIVVMNEGKIDAKGSHDELLKSSELYRSLIEKSQATERFAY
ncbi:MAG TPA: hypothetical protein PLI57_11415, partial [Spirochaetota bacterium]|nr:hypothetical protein [Spirochaetota bacterium]HQJ06971.1 hypothetical protein [Spirochaetota bacterium]